MTGARRLAVAAAALLVLTGCRSYSATVDAASSTGAAAGTTAAPAAQKCPAKRAAPDPHRPRIDLDVRLSDDLKTVTGTETVRFTPDRPTGELVFRLLPNGRLSAAVGNRLTVDRVRGDDVTGSGYLSARAGEPGGLYRVRLRSTLAAGRTTRVVLSFTLTLGKGTFDRFGTDDGLAWWASGAPLLAWEPGVGWAEDPFVQLLGETATSPAAATSIRVSAPADLTVLMTGAQEPPSAARDGRRTWTSRETAARDVSIAAGHFATRTVTTLDGVAVTVGVLPGARVDVDTLAGWTTGAISALEARFGPFPYRTLTVPLLPEYGGGIEYPSSVLLAAADRPVLVHEVAHMWFYGMVGDDQYRDPWLDEAFASYAAALVAGPRPPAPADLAPALAVRGDVGSAMGQFRGDGPYFSVVYGKGAAALLTARADAGADAFDAAVRCYVDANAWRIATPRSFGAVLGPLPAASGVLLRTGALRPDDLPR